MKLARYIGEGHVAIREEAEPTCPPSGLLVRTLACGLCSGELMDWYMDQKAPHVLGHEVCGEVIESQDERFPVGCRVFPHHHAPCLECETCRKGLHVHCEQWKRTKLNPGGMAEKFAVAQENLNDTLRVDDLRPIDAALIEPLACVMKSIRQAGPGRAAVIGLGSLGLMHLLALGEGATGYDLAPKRLSWATGLGLKVAHIEEAEPADVVFVCPGSAPAADTAIEMARPGGTILLFAPLPPTAPQCIALNKAYFRDLRLVSSYSCGPNDTQAAAKAIRAGTVRAEQVVSDFIGMDELPGAYHAMKAGDILKAMVVFS